MHGDVDGDAGVLHPADGALEPAPEQRPGHVDVVKYRRQERRQGIDVGLAVVEDRPPGGD